MGAPRKPDDEITPVAWRQRKYREDPVNRLKGHIRGRVNYALKTGRLVRQPCDVCGAAKVEAHHHNGYDLEHALDVQWLCKAHHEVIHPTRNRPPKRTREQVVAALRAAGSLAEAARLLGVGKPTLVSYLDRYGLHEEEKAA
jgi:transcriptional regulator with GAF, ATPase, and Fis domain